MKRLENLVRVEIALENCDHVVIPTEDIRCIAAAGITESFEMHNILGKITEDIDYYRHAEIFRLIIADKPEYQRLTERNDIAQVHLYDSEGNHEWFFVYWGENEYDNSDHQKSRKYRDQIDITIEKVSE